jgi:hypothetical protein
MATNPEFDGKKRFFKTSPDFWIPIHLSFADLALIQNAIFLFIFALTYFYFKLLYNFYCFRIGNGKQSTINKSQDGSMYPG